MIVITLNISMYFWHAYYHIHACMFSWKTSEQMNENNECFQNVAVNANIACIRSGIMVVLIVVIASFD